MGVCLYFKSVERVAPEVEEAIRADMRGPQEPQPWVVCEPPHLYPTEAEGRLRGGSKLSLHPWADEWAEAAQMPTERSDLQELLHRLSVWSAQHGITWELEVEGTALGRIENGVCSADVEAALEAFADVGEYLVEEYPHDWPGPDFEDPTAPRLRIWPEPE